MAGGFMEALRMWCRRSGPAALHVVLYGGVMASGRQPGDKSVAVVSRRGRRPSSRRERRRPLAEVVEDLSQRWQTISLAESTEDLSQRSPSAQRKTPAFLGVLCEL